jgi:hypothetical protein
MARPERNNVDYFPFYCEDGKKMFYLEETYGNDGFATFIKLLRELAKTDYHFLDLSKNTTLMFLSAKCKITKETLLSIITDLVELEKFDSKLWGENSIIWCQDFIDSIQDAYSRRNNKCITYEGLLLHLISLGIRKPIKSKPKDSSNPQSIVEYNKTKERKEERIIKFKTKVLEFRSKYSDSMLKEFFEYWTESGDDDKKLRFEKETSFSVTRRLGTWSKNESKFNSPGNKKQGYSTFSQNINLQQLEYREMQDYVGKNREFKTSDFERFESEGKVFWRYKT